MAIIGKIWLTQIEQLAVEAGRFFVSPYAMRELQELVKK
jgi:hypothetical protein